MLHVRKQRPWHHVWSRWIQHNAHPSHQLDRLHQLATKVNKTSSVNEKRDLLRQYPCCFDILERIYDPHWRHFLSSKAIKAHLSRQQPDHVLPVPAESLSTLLDALSSRQLTGNAALEAAASFFKTYCRTPEQQHIFCRVLDRNLKMGVAVQTVQRIIGSVSPETQSKTTLSDRPPFSSVALAMPIKSLKSLFSKHSVWYASRKLDGVRCLAILRRTDDGGLDVQFYSRTARRFDSLAKVKHAIEQLPRWPKEDVVLDGEICVYKSDDEQEDFLTAVRQIRRRQQDMDNPVYQVFDLISLQDFAKGKGTVPFEERQKQLAALLGQPTSHLRIVPQIQLCTSDALEALRNDAIRKGWEGLILRDNTPYEGKRSRHMLKLKEWEDAEYVVKQVETGPMRLQTGQERVVLTNVIIEHKGSSVSVGSGFSIQQRIQYAEYPERILGKPITVRYFSESVGESGQPSLRFPTVKAVYEEGTRDV